ncbi:hypothetical protein ACB098_11G197600 [Castanea mollissima]
MVTVYKFIWQQKMQIASRVARGLMYLHEECNTQIIHWDIKPIRTLTSIRGTKGYIALEWFRNTPVTIKVDVYSFQVMLLKITCCKRCAEIEMERATILTEWACECYYQGKVERLVENDEEALSDLKWVKKLVMMAILCIQDVPSSRASMREVIHMLEGIHVISTPPCPFLYNSTFEPDFRSS